MKIILDDESQKIITFGLTILYGSQTDNARFVAEGLGENALAQGLDSRVLSIADFKPRDLAKERALLILVSTQGG